MRRPARFSIDASAIFIDARCSPITILLLLLLDISLRRASHDARVDIAGVIVAKMFDVPRKEMMSLMRINVERPHFIITLPPPAPDIEARQLPRAAPPQRRTVLNIYIDTLRCAEDAERALPPRQHHAVTPPPFMRAPARVCCAAENNAAVARPANNAAAPRKMIIAMLLL